MKDNFTLKFLRVLTLVLLGITGSYAARAQYRTTYFFVNSESHTGDGVPNSITLQSFETYTLGIEAPGPLDGQGRCWSGTVKIFGNYSMACGFGGGGSVNGSQMYPMRMQLGDVPFYGPYATYGCMNARFAYEMLPPQTITVTPPANSCANQQMTLYSENTDLYMFSNSVVTTAMCWEYNISTNGVWKEMDTSAMSFYLDFNPADKIPEVKTAAQNVRFRCRIRARYPSAGAVYYSDYSPITSYYTIQPPPPNVDRNQIVVTPACYGLSNGRITLPGSGLTSNGAYTNMRWLIRPGNAPVPCNIDAAPVCGEITDQSVGAVSISAGVQSQPIIPQGTYTLWIANPSGAAGNCVTTIDNIVVGSLTQLKIVDNGAPQTASVSCPNNSDGSIGVTASGSNPSLGYYFTLKNTSNNIIRSEVFTAGTTMLWQNLPAGNYVAVVKDGACGSEAAVNINISAPPQINGDKVASPPTCNTPGNGSITVTALTPGVRYIYNLYRNGNVLVQQSGITTETSYTFNGLSGDAYSVEILNADKPLCAGWRTPVQLLPATPLSLQLNARDSVSCFGGNDGRLRFTAAGGAGSYQFTLTKSGGGTPVTNTTGNFNGLTAGSYSVRLTNQLSGCNDELNQPFDVYERSPLQVQVTGTNINCNGTGNGVVAATVTGGSTFYDYTWQRLQGGSWVTDPFWFHSDPKIEDLDPGTYRVIITDTKSTGCTITSAEVEITEPPALAITDIVVKEPVCDEGANINITATGGTGAYTFEWSIDGGNNYNVFYSNSSLYTPGDYTLKVTDTKGCKIVAPVTYKVTLPDGPLDFTIQRSTYNGGFNVSCFGARDGSITLVATGGNGGSYSGYKYQLDTGPFTTNNTFTNMAAGVYIFHVMDGRGCSISRSVRLTQPQMFFAATKEDIKCYGQSTGRIITNMSGGAAPYVVSIDGQVLVNGATDANLPKGAYTVHVVDANNCTRDTVINISYSYPQLKVTSAVAKDIQCFGGAGNITVAATGGDGVYTYFVSKDNWATSIPYTSGADLAAGNYAVQVTDGQGCSAIYENTVSITSPAVPLSLSAVLSDYNGYNISCKGGDNGTAQITATGGNGAAYSGYTYAIDNGPFGAAALITGVKAGAHILRVKDARGCEATATYNFTEASLALDIDLVSKEDVSCALATNGSITVAGAGGAGALEYSIDNQNWQSGTTFTGLGVGSYTVYVRDANRCGLSMTVQINSQNQQITINNIVTTDIVCFGETGTINITATGGTGGLSNEYALNGAAWQSFNNNTPLLAGTYKVRVKDGAGCYSVESAPIDITTPSAALKAAVTTSDFNGLQISCYGLSNGAITLNTTGGNGGAYAGYQYSLNNGAWVTNGSFTGLKAGDYTIQVKDARGCAITETATLKQAAAPVSIKVTDIQDLPCGAKPTGKITLEGAGGIAPYAYNINNDGWGAASEFTNLTAGTYDLQVMDLNGCVANTTATVKALQSPLVATAQVTPVNCFGETSGAIRVNVTGGDGNYIYSWSELNLTGPDALNIGAGSYNLQVTDGAGCNEIYTYDVIQPDQLTIQTNAPAICDGQDNGTINITAQGGLTPYQYRINEGGWQGNGSFDFLAAGDYQALVQDANGCTGTAAVTIQKSNTKPDVNFLVASRKNALDTLVIKEISLPAPDQVSWTYSPEATFLGLETDGTPLIKFSQPGTYWIRMEALFGGCTYALQKEIHIDPYDPVAGPGYTLPVHVIDTVTLSPNPNDGNFRFRIKLNRSQQVVVYVIDVNGARAGMQQFAPSQQIDGQFALNGSIAGVYILRVIAENESRDVRFIITR